ncbi:MAG: hypothetical protein A2Y10_06880 [Planctomycetes bacterium GWF2_41_51]|nr:MAG: hypothetical protein A2Y10_06880 [Planctomycetes bacterium GWF2_41_51]
MTEEQVRCLTRFKMRRFFDEIEKKAKRLKPEKFIPYVLKFFHNPMRREIIGPHTILQAIEANCAYHKSGYDEEITHKKFADIINLIMKSEEENDFYLWSIHNRLEIFFQFINRIQIEVQKTGFSKYYLSRYWNLFYDNDHIRKMHNDFENIYKISVEKWFLCSFAMYAMFAKDFIIPKEFKISSSMSIDENDISTYLNFSCYSVAEIQERYFETRKNIKEEFHFLVRTVFVERPIVLLDGDQLVAPVPELLFRHMGHGLNDLFEKIDSSYGCYLGKAFQEYTKKTLNCLSNVVLYSNEELEKLSAGDKSCDFLLATQSENILIECKAIDLKVRTLTENAIFNSNAFSKIKDGICQIDNTLNNIMNGKLCLPGIDTKKPFLKMVVTFGEMFGFNSDWIFNKMCPQINYDEEKNLKPMIFSIAGLEKFVLYIENSSESLIDIYHAKRKDGYFATGDWDNYLSSKIASIKPIKNDINFLNEGFDSMLDKFEIDFAGRENILDDHD